MGGGGVSVSKRAEVLVNMLTKDTQRVLRVSKNQYCEIRAALSTCLKSADSDVLKLRRVSVNTTASSGLVIHSPVSVSCKINITPRSSITPQSIRLLSKVFWVFIPQT